MGSVEPSMIDRDASFTAKERLKNNFDFLTASFGALPGCEYSP